MTLTETPTELVIVQRVTTRVHERLPDVSLQSIEAEVTCLLQQYAECKVRLYLPILVERGAIDRLRHGSTSEVERE